MPVTWLPPPADSFSRNFVRLFANQQRKFFAAANSNEHGEFEFPVFAPEIFSRQIALDGETIEIENAALFQEFISGSRHKKNAPESNSSAFFLR